MADYTPIIAPFINVTFYVTAKFGEYPSGGVHKGLDIATTNEANLYSIVTRKSNTEKGIKKMVLEIILS